MQAIRRGDRGKNLVFFDDMSPLQHRKILSFPVQREISIDELVRNLIAPWETSTGRTEMVLAPGVQTSSRNLVS